MGEICIVPEPQSIKSSDKRLVFSGFENFPEFLMREFNVPKGDWKIVKIDQSGTGLEVRDGEIAIWGDESIDYATILQMIKQGKGYLPEVRILESLQFEFRGYHLDVARSRVPHVETFKRILRWLFLLKYNYFGIYFEDLFPLKRYPQIGEHRGRVEEKELREVIEYGNSLGIEVFPSLELSGHMEHILSLPEFHRFSEWHRPREGCLDLSNEEARRFAYDLLDEVIDFFPSKYVHIGGDETWAIGRGRSLNKTWRFRGPELYEMHHRNMIEIVKRKEKEPIVWGDMISGAIHLGGMDSKTSGMKWAELTESEIWKDVLAANWDYSPSSIQHFRQKVRRFKDKGIDQIACPGLSSGDRYYPPYPRVLRNLKNFLTVARQENLLGFLVTAWGDMGGECLFSFLDPLILAAMEFAEGDGKWEEKWMALSGENEDVLKARIMLGNNEISNRLKRVLSRDFFFYRWKPEEKDDLKAFWRESFQEVEETSLPEDLDFIRRLVEIGIKVLEDDVKASDYISAANIYSRLWLKERKPEGLDRIIERFWGAAGKQESRIWTPRFQDLFLDL